MGDLCTVGGSGLPAVAGFVGMWGAMMIPMMLPSLAPSLWGYGSMSRAAIAGSAYCLVWIAAGLAAYPLHLIATRVPSIAGIVLIACGLLQSSPWKARRLAACRVRHAPATVSAAGCDGLRLGVHCVARCASVMLALLAVGAMSPAAMLGATAAITGERYLPRAAKPIGAVIAGTGVLMIARSL